MSRIKPGNLPEPRHIPKAEAPVDAPLRFSFKLLDLYSNQKFRLDHCRDGYLDRFLCRLRDLCGLSVRDFRTNKSKALRAHRITWSETSEPAGFSRLNSQMREEEAWQFEITANEHGRIHGLLQDDTFFVVWIDPTHALYP
jgi:hypothetical protein